MGDFHELIFVILAPFVLFSPCDHASRLKTVNRVDCLAPYTDVGSASRILGEVWERFKPTIIEKFNNYFLAELMDFMDQEHDVHAS